MGQAPRRDASQSAPARRKTCATACAGGAIPEPSVALVTATPHCDPRWAAPTDDIKGQSVHQALVARDPLVGKVAVGFGQFQPDPRNGSSTVRPVVDSMQRYASSTGNGAGCGFFDSGGICQMHPSALNGTT